MSAEYCRQWAIENGFCHDPVHDAPIHQAVEHVGPVDDDGAIVDTDTPLTCDPDMTAHRPPHPPSPRAAPRELPSVRSPSPVAHASEDEDDDGLSLGSSESDLETSWLNVPRSEGGTSVSGSVSALGSAAVSDLDPSSDSDDREWASEFDSEGPTLRHIPHVAQPHHDDDDTDSDDGHEDTPSPLSSFQRSYVFPDPNSVSTSLTASAFDNQATPVPSIVDITAKDLKGSTGSSASFFDSALDRGSKTQRVTADKTAKDKETSPVAGPSSAATPKPFPAGPPPPKRRQLTALISVFAFALLFLKLGPATINLDISGLIANTFAPPGPLDAAPPQVTSATATPPAGWLGADLQVVRDALSVFNAPESAAVKTVPPSKPEHPPVAEATSTAYRWFRSEYRWSREDANKPITDVSLAPPSSLSTKGEQIVASLNESYDAVGTVLQSNMQLVSQYLNWTLQNLAAFASLAVDAVQNQIEVELRTLRAVAEALFSPERVRSLFDDAAAGAAYSQNLVQESLQRASRASARLCANDRCSPARAREVAGRTVSEARRRGYETLHKARRGLGNVIRVANDAVGKAASEAQSRYSSATDTDCLRDRDSKKSCYSSPRRKRSGKDGKYKAKAAKAKGKDKDKRHAAKAKHGADKGHARHNKCPFSRRLMRGCRAGGAVSTRTRTNMVVGRLTKQRD